MSLPVSTIQDALGRNLRLIESYRRKHNEMGQKFRNGEITEKQWMSFKTRWSAERMETLRALNATKDAVKARAKDLPLQILKDRIRYPAEYTTLEQKYSYIWALRSQINLRAESNWSNLLESELAELKRAVKELENVDE